MNIDMTEISNPCMKCGSVQCAVCSEDLEKHFILKQKVREAIQERKKNIMKMCKNDEIKYLQSLLLDELLKELGLDDIRQDDKRRKVK